MSKSRDKNEREYLLGEIRSLKSQIKHLKKELGRATKTINRNVDLEDIVKELEEDSTEPVFDKCPSCKKGKLIKTDLGTVRVLHKCNWCSFRKTEKIK